VSNIIEFQSAAQLRKLLQEREAEIALLKEQLNNQEAVKEMLKLQVLDLNDQVAEFIKQMGIIQKNLVSLQKKLD